MSAFIYQNYLDTRFFPTHVLTSQDEWASVYGIENIINPLLTVVWRSGTLDTRINLDTLTGVNPTHLILNAHNLTATAVITLEACDDNDFTTPTFTHTITWESYLLMHSFTAASYRYWSIHIVDANNTNYIEIGHAFLGTALSLVTGAHNSFQRKKIDDSKRTISPTRGVYGSISGHTYNSYAFNFAWVTDTERIAIDAMYDDYVRNCVTFYFQLPDTYTSNKDIMYCVIDPPDFTQIIKRSDGSRWSMKTTLYDVG